MSGIGIRLTNGGHTLVDSDVAETLGSRKIWHDADGYAQTIDAGAVVRLHRWILDAQPGQTADHINGDRLDNRRANLRVVSHSLNILNSHRTWGGSPFFGVSVVGAPGCYQARLQVQHKRHCIGWYRSDAIAALFYDRAKRALVGERVTTNFPRSIPRLRVCRLIAETSGRIFSVVFSRRTDGSQRVMTCRTGVTSHSKGTGASYCPCLRGLALVWDVHKRAYRTIPVDRVIAIKFAKINYRIEGNHDHAYAQTRRAA